MHLYGCGVKINNTIFHRNVSRFMSQTSNSQLISSHDKNVSNGSIGESEYFKLLFWIFSAFSLRIHPLPFFCAPGKLMCLDYSKRLLCPLASSWVWPIGDMNARSGKGREQGPALIASASLGGVIPPQTAIALFYVF